MIAARMEAVTKLLKNDKEKWQVEDVCKYVQVLLWTISVTVVRQQDKNAEHIVMTWIGINRMIQ